MLDSEAIDIKVSTIWLRSSGLKAETDSSPDTIHKLPQEKYIKTSGSKMPDMQNI